MNPRLPVTFSADAEGIGWIIFDDPAARANVFTPATQQALERALDQVEAAEPPLKAVVITSGKERIFMAGADLKMLAALPDAKTAEEFARRGQLLFQRIAASPRPFVCAIHGACAGGGFELALACQWRIASDAPVTQIGLPETSLGTIPGWGGSVRLPRLVGVKAALDHILQGRLIAADAALSEGFVNEVAPPIELKGRAKIAAIKLAAEGVPSRPSMAAVPREVMADLRRRTEQRFGGHQPAMLAAIDVVEATAELPIDSALGIEARFFGEVTAGATCKNLIHVFFLREAAKKRTLDGWFEESSTRLRWEQGVTGESDRPARRSGPTMDRVGIVGAGVMGSGIAQWLATRGFDVVMRDVDEPALQRGMTVVRGLFDDAVKREKITAGAANAGLQRIATTTAWEGFAECDLVLEAIVENVEAKRQLFEELARVTRPGTILASNTSALPIEEIAGRVTDPERTIGIHFFNPVSRMALVELVLAPRTSQETASRVLAFIQALGKAPIVCRSSPGFLVTRVLFFYLNAAVRQWEQGATAAELDGVMREFGWPMGPLRLIDEVGVDVTDFIFGEMEHYFPGRFERTTTCGRLLAAGLRGRKNGTSRGFYRYEDGKERVNEEEMRPLAHARGYGEARGRTETRTDVADALMRVMVDEAQRCLDEGVVKSADDVDFALLSGAGFPAWRGGLMRWARTR